MGSISTSTRTSKTTPLTSFHISEEDLSPPTGQPVPGYRPTHFQTSHFWQFSHKDGRMRQKPPASRGLSNQCHFWQIPLVKASHRFIPYSGGRSVDALSEGWRNKVKYIGIHRKDERALAKSHKDLLHNMTWLSLKSFRHHGFSLFQTCGPVQVLQEEPSVEVIIDMLGVDPQFWNNHHVSMHSLPKF